MIYNLENIFIQEMYTSICVSEYLNYTLVSYKLELTVSEHDFFEEIWKKTTSSPAII